MTPEDYPALAPLIAMGLTAVATMLAAPLARTSTVRMAACIGLFAAATLAWRRIGLPEGPGLATLADDGLSRFGALFSALSALGALVFMRSGGAFREGPALVALVALGGGALAAASHAATLFLGVEIVSMSLVGLFASGRGRGALEAGYKYLLLGGAASAALLLGVATLYAETGALDLAAWGGAQGGLAAAGAALILVGLGFKFALVPFHAWTPDTYDAAPPAAAALAAAASKGALALALLRIADAGAPGGEAWTQGLALMAGASILLGNLLALKQRSIARMLGWSSVAHSGYVAAILSTGADLAPTATLFYLAAYAPALLAAFCVASALAPAARLDALRGVAGASPLAGAAFALSMLSLAGLPVASGFVAKVLLFGSLAQAGSWPLLGAAALGSAAGFYVYARFGLAPFRGPKAPAPDIDGANKILLALCAGAIVVLGVYPAPLLDFIGVVLR